MLRARGERCYSRRVFHGSSILKRMALWLSHDCHKVLIEGLALPSSIPHFVSFPYNPYIFPRCSGVPPTSHSQRKVSRCLFCGQDASLLQRRASRSFSDTRNSHRPAERLGGFPKVGVPVLGVPIIRIIIFWGLYWGPLPLGVKALKSLCLYMCKGLFIDM